MFYKNISKVKKLGFSRKIPLKYGLKNIAVKDLVEKRLEQRDTKQGLLFQVSN